MRTSFGNTWIFLLYLQNHWKSRRYFQHSKLFAQRTVTAPFSEINGTKSSVKSPCDSLVVQTQFFWRVQKTLRPGHPTLAAFDEARLMPHTRTHAYTYTHLHTRVHTLAHTHTRLHVHTLTHTRTHMHTHCTHKHVIRAHVHTQDAHAITRTSANTTHTRARVYMPLVQPDCIRLRIMKHSRT